MHEIMRKKNIWVSISGALVLLGLLSLTFWGFNYGIDFNGGALLELSFNENRPDNSVIIKVLNEIGIDQVFIQPTGDKGALIRTASLSEEQHQSILIALEKINNPGYSEALTINPSDLGIEGEGLDGASITATAAGGDMAKLLGDKYAIPAFKTFIEHRFESVGPSIGEEFKQKSIYAVIIVLIAIIAYIAYAFRSVSYPVESWKYGLSAVIALAHDIIIISGIFSVLGHFFNIQIDAYFITAVLTVLGFSVHDTIVTFDRIRENIKRRQDLTFENAINLSINETLVRSINTTLTTVIVMLAILLFGGATVKYFILALLCGAIVGTYSSIFIASPLLIWLYRFKNK